MKSCFDEAMNLLRNTKVSYTGAGVQNFVVCEMEFQPVDIFLVTKTYLALTKQKTKKETAVMLKKSKELIENELFDSFFLEFLECF